MIRHIHKLKDKSYMIISIHAEKAFDIIQHQYMVKKLSRREAQKERNIIKAIYDNPTATLSSMV